MGRIVLVLPLLLAACIDDGTKPVGGVNCGSITPNVQLRAVDAASGAPLPFSVTVDGTAPGASCDPTVAGDAPCTGTLTFVLFDAADIAVSSDGRKTATVHLDGGRLGGGQCSAPAYNFNLWIPLQAE